MLFTVPGSASPPRQVPAGQRPGAAVVQTIQNVITDCINAGLITPADPYAVTMCLWAALHGLIALRAARPHVAWPPLSTLTDTLLDLWLTSPEPSPG